MKNLVTSMLYKKASKQRLEQIIMKKMLIKENVKKEHGSREFQGITTTKAFRSTVCVLMMNVSKSVQCHNTKSLCDNCAQISMHINECMQHFCS